MISDQEIYTSGWVRWPTHLDVHPDRAGMWVYAVVPAQAANELEQFTHCTGPSETLLLPEPDFLTGSSPEVYPVAVSAPPIAIPDRLVGRRAVATYTEQAQQEIMARCDFGEPILAAVCLGTSNRSWVHPNGRYWRCTFDLVTVEGNALLARLQSLFGTHPRLVTYLAG